MSAPAVSLGSRQRRNVFFLTLVLSLVAFLWLFPFVFSFLASFKTGNELLSNIWGLPESFDTANYESAFRGMKYARSFGNSMFVSISVALLQCVTGTLAAFAFARMRFPGKEIIFMLFLATLMIPGTVTFLPNFLMVRGEVIPWGSWLNTLPALTVPFMSTAFVIFLFRQFFLGIPHELYDAARIDGAGHLRFLTAVVVPMSKPVIMTATLLTFVSSWNEFLWPLLVTTTATWRPLGVGLYTFISEAGPQTHLLMAGTVITVIPVLIVYFFTQKQFTEGIATSGLKG